MPNITSATDTHASAKPAVSVTMGARKVNAAKGCCCKVGAVERPA